MPIDYDRATSLQYGNFELRDHTLAGKGSAGILQARAALLLFRILQYI